MKKNKFKRVESDVYGVYDLEYVGTFDYEKLLYAAKDKYELFNVVEKYHPASYFRGSCLIISRKKEFDLMLDVYVVTDDSTKNWDFKSSQYYKDTGIKKHPLIQTKTKIDEWKRIIYENQA